jgi:hypothetical protein
METTTKIIFWPLNRVVHFVFFFLLWTSLGGSFLSERISSPETNFYLFLLTKLLLENAIITKKPFLGVTCVAGLEMGGNIFRKI